MADARDRLRDIWSRIAAAAERAGRDPSSVTLIAVTKTFGPAAIEPVLAAGHRDFGENRVQEARSKWARLKEVYPDVRLHLIGPLQTNKVREAVELFDAIHSLDRDKLAVTLVKEFGRQKRILALFVQVNTGEEPQKAGVAPREASAFLRRCRDEHRLAVDGLMGIPPEADDPARHFEMLRKLAAENHISALSAGMSADFETAIEHGATHVRIGSAIFGERG